MSSERAECVRTTDEVNAVIQATYDHHCKFQGMTYAEGVRAAIDWLTGVVDDKPMDD